MMHRTVTIVVLLAMGVSAAIAQQSTLDPVLATPRFDVSVGFNHVNANAPPGGCECFGLNGGYVAAGLHLSNWLGAEAEFTGGHANKISQLGQNLTLMTYMAGPKVTFPGLRIVPFGEALFGEAHGSDSYFPTATTSTSSASSFAVSAGGGLDVNLTSRFALRAFDVRYLRTTFPNGEGNEQNHLLASAGIVIKFAGRDHVSSSPPPHVAEERPSALAFSCEPNLAIVRQGQTLEIVGHASTAPGQRNVHYTWTSTAGPIAGSGQSVTIDTTQIPAGDYRVVGHAMLAADPSTQAQCQATFHVTIADAANSVGDNVAAAKADRVFHDNVPDALFDYDSYDIRPDAQEAVLHAAAYLKAHPAIRVLIGGYSDERGSAEYNVALSSNRATAARNALINAGVAAQRLEIISYGKEVQVCTGADEGCWQQNRRAAFSLHP